jgi:hypothetical protein
MRNLSLYLFALFIFSGCNENTSDNYLESGFQNPPAECKPKTWMHALSGNMTKEGLTKDLEAIAEVGLGGVLLFNVSANIPAGEVTYNSPKHHEMIKHAALECERLGLTFGFHNCDGWTSSGGPWITPENSMKMVVWSETIVTGGDVSTQLEQPFTRKDFYRDIAVLAYPSFASEIADSKVKPHITASDKSVDLTKITDGNPDNETLISGDKPWIQFDYGKVYPIQSLFMTVKERWFNVELLTSNDGVQFTKVKDLYKHKTVHQRDDIFEHFEPLNARYYRIQFSQPTTVKEVRLMSTYALGSLLPRTGINRIDDYHLPPIGTPASDMVIAPQSIINLTAQMDDRGMLRTTLPEGTYTVLRMGYTTNGLENAPSSEEGRGLECDKFSKKAIETHYNAFIRTAIDNLEGINSMQYIEIDSYEMAMQNWTDDLDSIFKAEKGYDLIPFLPLFAGRFVESPEASDAVLSDFRRFTCDLTTNNYYGHFTELANRDGLLTYFEPYGDGLINELDVAGTADINMGEFWLERKVRMMSAAISGSRIYGKNIVSAESFTSIPRVNWKGHPAMVKQKGDSAWMDGINEFMLHRFAHQANTHVKPGMTLDRWGFHFDRTNTWWYNAGAEWFKYMARGSFMLRQGIPVSDMLIYIGEGSPNAPFYRDDFEPNIPHSINFDCINTDALINRIRVEKGKLVLPDGISYRILVLKNCEKLSLKSLKKIHEIALAGVPVVGVTTIEPIGYLVSEELNMKFIQLVSEIKAAARVYTHNNWDAIFKDNGIIPDLDFAGRKDMGYTHRQTSDTDMYFFYNRDNSAQRFTCNFRVDGRIPELWNPVNGEIKKLGQFVHNEGVTTAWIDLEAEESVFVVFRESSEGVKSVNLADNPDLAGEYTLDAKNQLRFSTSKNGEYTARLNDGRTSITIVDNIPLPVKIEGIWEVAFLKENDYQATHTFDGLSDWKDSENNNIKYYSGTAIYRKTFPFDKSKATNEDRFMLDLGIVHVVAEVKLNGKNLGVLWLSPFRVDITDALVSGENKLEISITNQWTNRLIGDEQFPATDSYDKSVEKMPSWYVNNEPMPDSERTTFCTAAFYKATDPLMPSGLIGPVQIGVEKQKNQL